MDIPFCFWGPVSDVDSSGPGVIASMTEEIFGRPELGRCTNTLAALTCSPHVGTCVSIGAILLAISKAGRLVRKVD